MSAPTTPFTWWHTGDSGWQTPTEAPTLYRADEWVPRFLGHIDAELRRIELSSVNTFETNRAALVVTGGDGATQTLRLRRALYRDVLLFHPGLHPEVDEVMDEVLATTSEMFAREGSTIAERLRVGGRDLLLAEPGLLLHETVVKGLDELGLRGLPPVGVSGIVDVQVEGETFLLGVLRSGQVAVNPGCLGPSVDGGLPWNGGEVDPRVGLMDEVKIELPWLAGQRIDLFGTLLPPSSSTLVGGRHHTVRCGVNVVYRSSVDMPLDDLLRVPDHFEIDDLVLVGTTPGERGALPRVLCHRNGGLVPMEDLPPMSEPLAAILAHEGAVDVTAGVTAHLSPRAQRRPTEGRAMTSTKVPMELTLDDAWAEDVIERHSRLSRVLAPDELSEIAEGGAEPTLEKLGPVFDAVREYEFVRVNDSIKASDDARLFEALIYRLGRYLFGNSSDVALVAHDLMLPRPRSERRRTRPDEVVQNPIGLGYTDRLEIVKKQDIDEDKEGVWRNEVSEKLDKLNQGEAVQEYSEVARRGRLLCFCAALWILELKRSPSAATVALDDRYRKSLSGEVVALFFRARGLLVSPVISAAQAQLGLQFVTTALEAYGQNPGMHHTKANFLLRQSALTENEAESRACLEQALDSLETALKADAEFAMFYATRAKVKYRLREKSGALTDIRAAIELARYSAHSPAVRREITSWEETLESWQLAPLGS